MEPNNPITSLEPAQETILGMVDAVVRLLPNLALALVIILLAFIAGRLARRLATRATERAGLTIGARIVFGRFARWATVLAGLFVALIIVLPDFTPSSLLGALGVTSIAVGFAFKDILENLLAGLLMLIREPFQIGDTIVVDGYEGRVEEIETRATMLRTSDGRRVTMPNATVFTSALVINTAFEARRSEYDIGIGYGEDVERVKAMIMGVLGGVEGLLSTPEPECYAWDLADSAVVLRMRWWTKTSNRTMAEVRDRVLVQVKAELDAHGIDIPFPVRTVQIVRKAAPDDA